MSESSESETRIKSISVKLQELSDNARERFMKKRLHIEKRNIRIRWAFPEIIQSSRYETICPTANDISEWPEWYLTELYPLFPDGQIIEDVFAIHYEDNTPARGDVEQLSKANLYIYLKDRLKRAIETTIGRQILARTTPVNYCLSDPENPNYFEWKFSPEYPNFPPSLSPPSSSRADRDDLYKCIEALQMGHLRVVPLETAPLDEKVRVSLEQIEAIVKKGREFLWREADRKILKLIEEATGKKENGDDLPEVMADTSVIMKHWKWNFSQHYREFHHVIRGAKKRRNRIAEWPIEPLRKLIHAIDMGYLTLSPRSEGESDAMQKPLKPRTADGKRGRGRPPGRRTLPKITQDTDASDFEDEELIYYDRTTQDTADSTYEDDQDNHLGETIRVQSPLPNATRHAKRGNISGLASNQKAKPTSNILRKDPSQNTKLAPSSTQQLFEHWYERVANVFHDDFETLTLSLEQDDRERGRLQQTIDDQQAQIARNEKELAHQTLVLDSQKNNLLRWIKIIDAASSRLNGERERDDAEVVDNGLSRSGESAPDHTPKPLERGQKESTEFEAKLRRLITKLGNRIDELDLQKKGNATKIATLTDQQTDLRQQLKEREEYIKKANQRVDREGETLAGRGLQSMEEEPVLLFVAQHPIFKNDAKIRQLRNIYINWKDLPHNLFHEMLPPGHDLSESTLMGLTTLSDRFSSAEVLYSFREEIQRRTAHQPGNPRGYDLIPDDVWNTLRKFGIVGQPNQNTQPQTASPLVPLQAKLPSTMNHIPQKSKVSTVGVTNQGAGTHQDKIAKKQTQTGQLSTGPRNLQPPAAAQMNPLTTARNQPFTANSNNQGYRSESSQLPPKRKGDSVLTDTFPSKRAKSNSSDIYSAPNSP